MRTAACHRIAPDLALSPSWCAALALPSGWTRTQRPKTHSADSSLSPAHRPDSVLSGEGPLEGSGRRRAPRRHFDATLPPSVVEENILASKQRGFGRGAGFRGQGIPDSEPSPYGSVRPFDQVARLGILVTKGRRSRRRMRRICSRADTDARLRLLAAS